ncbi:MAG: GntR family transcriptional regulator [Bacillota bacterium]
MLHVRRDHMIALRVDRDNGIPLYIQLREQIAHLIESGLWQEGFKLPTERRMAQLLGVSRNTVGLAYRDLVERGLLFSQQGLGTFVKDSARSNPDKPEETIQMLVDSLLDQVVEMGIDLSTAERAFRRGVEERRSLLARVTVAFIECNCEQLDYFSRSLELGAGIHVMPVLISQVLAGDDREELMSRIRAADLVVTTFFHLDEMERILGPGVDVLGIALDPEMETMVRIAQLPREQPVGLVCLSETFADRVMKSMVQSGLGYFDVQVETSRESEQVKGLVDRVGALIVSPGRRKQVEGLMGEGKPLIEFIYKLDAGSINMLQSRLLDRTRKE